MPLIYLTFPGYPHLLNHGYSNVMFGLPMAVLDLSNAAPSLRSQIPVPEPGRSALSHHFDFDLDLDVGSAKRLCTYITNMIASVYTEL